MLKKHAQISWDNVPTTPNLMEQLADNCIQNFHLGKYIVRYMAGNLILR